MTAKEKKTKPRNLGLSNRVGVKFLLIVAAFGVVFSALVVYRTWSASKERTKELLSRQAELALYFDLAIREYVSSVVRPFAEEHVGPKQFVPEVMSTSFVARSVFEKVRRQFPDYIIKFSSDNPRNPANKASEGELRVLEDFRRNPNRKTWSGRVRISDKEYQGYFYARRMKQSCLHCHGEPETAPAALLERYGSKGGFHRKLGEVVALDTVAIPVQKYQAAARAEAIHNSLVFMAALLVLLAAIYWVFHQLVGRRLALISTHFKNTIEQSNEIVVSPIEEQGSDEIGLLAQSFNTLAGRLQEIFDSLEQRVDERTRELKAANRQLERQIVEREQAQADLVRASQQWRVTFDAIRDMISIQDKNFRIIKVNKAFAETFRTSPERLVGQKCYKVVHGTDGPWPECPHLRTLETGKAQKEEFFDPGLQTWLEVSTWPVFNDDGEITGSVHIGKDVTRRRKIRQERDELLAELEAKNRELRDFAHIVAHDLKAPLRGVDSVAKWILEDYGETLDEQGKKQLQLLGNRVRRMHKLIDGILQYSKLGQNKAKQVEVDLNELIPDVIDAVNAPNNITITIANRLPTILCEKTQITQVFQNLLSNAINYMDKAQGRITISCTDDGNYWKFSVTDNGPGIEEKHFDRIFKVFQTLTPRDESERTGIGLSVVKKIIELHGGRIWVESEPGRGSSFYFTLPKHKMGGKRQ